MQGEQLSETRSAVPSAPKRGVPVLDYNKYKSKRYLHFDHKVKIEKVESYLTNQKDIAKHSFLPFIHYVSSFDKYTGEKHSNKDNRPIKTKDRDIMYAGHLDNFIYKYYADEILNKKYNSNCALNNIDECVTAYRNNKNGMSNIDFAAEIINNIIEFKESYILVGDFTSFFDKINHKLLKVNLMKVLEVQKLSNDWYNVYRSITKYGYYEKTFLEEKFGTDKQLRSSGKRSYFKQLKEFREFQKQFSSNKNMKRDGRKSEEGIPQGSAISAVCANVYAIEFDLVMKKIADQHSGLYRRYSDDFILILPKKQAQQTLTCRDMKKIEIEVRKVAAINKIEIQESKTGLYEYHKSRIKSLIDPAKNHLDYLGFVFDGKTVKMRGKSPYKFYRKAYQVIDIALKVKNKKKLKRIPYRKKIYSLYTDLGIDSGEYGNFITYAKKAQEKFDVLSPNTDNMMMRQIKNRKKKIEKRLGVRIHTKIN